MKITPRLLVILACAWCGLPLLGIALHPAAFLRFWTQAPLNLAPVLVRAAFLAIGWGAYVHRGWIGRAALGLAIAWTAITVALAVLTPFGVMTIALVVRRASSILPDDVVIAGVGALVANFWSLLAWSWAVAIVARRVRKVQVDPAQASRSFASRDAGENHLVHGGVALILAWLLAWPIVHDWIAPLRELRPGTWTTDASHARIVLTDAQRRQASAATLEVVDEINDDIGQIAAGGTPTHSTRENHGISTRYVQAPGRTWELLCYTVDGRLSQIDVYFNADSLRREIGQRKFLLR